MDGYLKGLLDDFLETDDASARIDIVDDGFECSVSSIDDSFNYVPSIDDSYSTLSSIYEPEVGNELTRRQIKRNSSLGSIPLPPRRHGSNSSSSPNLRRGRKGRRGSVYRRNSMNSTLFVDSSKKEYRVSDVVDYCRKKEHQSSNCDCEDKKCSQKQDELQSPETPVIGWVRGDKGWVKNERTARMQRHRYSRWESSSPSPMSPFMSPAVRNRFQSSLDSKLISTPDEREESDDNKTETTAATSTAANSTQPSWKSVGPSLRSISTKDDDDCVNVMRKSHSLRASRTAAVNVPEDIYGSRSLRSSRTTAPMGMLDDLFSSPALRSKKDTSPQKPTPFQSESTDFSRRLLINKALAITAGEVTPSRSASRRMSASHASDDASCAPPSKPRRKLSFELKTTEGKQDDEDPMRDMVDLLREKVPSKTLAKLDVPDFLRDLPYK